MVQSIDLTTMNEFKYLLIFCFVKNSSKHDRDKTETNIFYTEHMWFCKFLDKYLEFTDKHNLNAKNKMFAFLLFIL